MLSRQLGLRIVRLTEAVAGDVARLWRQCFPNEVLWAHAAWNPSGEAMTRRRIERQILTHRAFEPAGSFVALAQGRVAGFCIAVMPSDRRAREGYLCALVVEPRLRRQGIGSRLLQCAERYLARCGAQRVVTTFESNPLALLPGVPTDAEAYPFLLNRGFRSYDRDLLLVMRLEVSRFRFPRVIRERIQHLASRGMRIGRMEAHELRALDELLASDFPAWRRGIISALKRCSPPPVIVAARGKRILGFSGPFRVQGSGRGNFYALGVAPTERRHGLGGVLFNTMCAELRAAGARFVVLTTGLANPAQEIYVRAGFRTCYVVDYGMQKELEER